MNEVKVKKSELLDKLKANREQHKKIFLEAQEGFRAAVIQQLDEMLADARNGGKIRQSVQLIDPVNQVEDYDCAIRMLEMSVDDQVTISHEDFKCFVLDQWRWKQLFMTSNSYYSNTAGASGISGMVGWNGPE